MVSMATATQESSFKVTIEAAENTIIRVLHVDDDSHFLKIAKQCLETDASIKVETATSAEEAIGKLGDGKYDVIVSDYQMPGKNGLEFLKELRSNGKTFPFIMFTGKGREEIAIEALNLGANRYLNKGGETETVYAELAHSITELARTRKAEEKLFKSEEALLSLRDSEEKFRSLAENSPNIIFINKKGRLVYVNKRAEEIMGYNREEFCSANFNFMNLIAQESEKPVESAFSRQMQGEDVAPFEFKIVTKEGRKLDVILSSKLMRYEGESAVLGMVTDITYRKESEKTILESQQKFEGLFIGNPEAAVYLSPDFHILDINPRFEELFGYSLAEIKGKHLDDIVVQKDKMGEADMLNGKAAQGYVYHNTLRRRKDESLVPVSISAAPITADSRLIGYVGMYKDISELKKTERTLALMNEKLRVVGGLTRHDTRNKLAVITGNIFLMRKKMNNPDIVNNLNDIESASQQVERILGFARDYEMLGVEELVYIDVEQVINEAVSLFPEMRELELANNCVGLTLLADSLLRQLFYNLIDNSLKYGQKVKNITTRYEKTADEQLKLIYEDDGIGIPPDVKPKIFNEGYTTGKGSGYGLYLIKKMMEVYGWTIQETSGPGRGAVFTITIPKVNDSGKANYRLP
jgi:PAS domain S-box-containing protein